MAGVNDRYAMNSVLRAAQILHGFSLENPTYTHSEISRKLGLNKAAVTRLLYSLEKAGLIEKDPESGRYGLTIRLYQIGSVYINLTGIPQAARPALVELTAACEESSHICILRDFEIVYIDKVESPKPIRMMSYVGRKLPAYCTGTGKAILAHLGENYLKEFLRKVRLQRRTPNTITRGADFKAALEKVRKAGYATDHAENEPEVMSIAAPVRDQGGKVVAAVSIAGPVYRMNGDRKMAKFVPAVVRAAETVSRRLGYAGPPGREEDRGTRSRGKRPPRASRPVART